MHGEQNIAAKSNAINRPRTGKIKPEKSNQKNQARKKLLSGEVTQTKAMPRKMQKTDPLGRESMCW